MKKFIVVKNGKEINFGDKILITKSANTPLGITIVRKVAIVTKELTDKIFNNAIKNLAKKTNWKEEKLLNILNTLYLANPWAATQMVLREIAIELDKKYNDHINESEHIFAISPQDGRVHEINKAHIKNYRAFPAFRTINDAKIACSLVRENLKSIFTNA